jgi:hypothetical protein
MRFSERIGKRQPKIEIQLDSMDEDLQNGLWNVLNIYIFDPMQASDGLSYSPFRGVIESIWFNFFKEPLDQLPYGTSRVVSFLRERFFSWDYLEVYDFIDFVANLDHPPFDKEHFIEMFNFILKRELSGYRFVSGQLAPITNPVEIAEVEKAIANSLTANQKGVNIHLQAALDMLADKKSPDYRNSIKESISAVESICQVMTADPKAELGKALKVLKQKVQIHGALEQGFSKMYGYTSDSDGIRHAMLDESQLDQEDALFMLVACSAFINYLTVKATKTGATLTS